MTLYRPTPDDESRKWLIVALLLASTTINYIDRQTVSVLAPFLSREFGCTSCVVPPAAAGQPDLSKKSRTPVDVR